MISRDQLIAQIVPDYTGWLRTVARGMLSPLHEALDDLVQEGYIAMWRAVISFDPDQGQADYWLKTAALNRMKTVVTRNHWTGQEQRFNGGHGGSQAPAPVLSLQSLTADVEGDYDPEDVDSVRALDEVLETYHAGEIAEAISKLTPKQQDYVRLRFWEGLSHTEMTPHFGYVPNALWSSKRNGAKIKLEEALAHLA